jgi:colanic acid biosynthesis glycosyl transferase WcaI
MGASPERSNRRIVVLCPHFAPDTAPTGTVMTRIVEELTALGHEVHVVTSLPWYRRHRVEGEWTGRRVRCEQTEWGSITRVTPFPGGDRSNIVRRAAGFIGFSLLAGFQALRAGRAMTRIDVVVAMSPPLTLGLTGWLVSRLRRGRLVFNIQDVFPDAAIETGAIRNRWVIAVARALERASYRAADAVTVLSDDLRTNVIAKVPAGHSAAVHTIPNFVDTDEIVPSDRMTDYRRELGLGAEAVVLYAGNVGFSQSLDLVIAAARELPDVSFVINGEGSARPQVEADAADVANLVVADYVPASRLAELLATGDVHVVPLRSGLGRVSVPSKTYSIMAAGRPVLAAIDEDTVVPQTLDDSGSGISVPPDDPTAFVDAVREMVADPERAAGMGRNGRAWVEKHASPTAVGAAYDTLIGTLSRR